MRPPYTATSRVGWDRTPLMTWSPRRFLSPSSGAAVMTARRPRRDRGCTALPPTSSAGAGATRCGSSGPSLAEQVTDRVAAQAVRGQLAAALGALSGAYRDTLLLVASGLTHEEVAIALGVPVGTVASRLARARRKLRSALGGVNPTRSDPDTQRPRTPAEGHESMNEMELVKDFCAAEPPPSPQRLATARATVAASIGDPELAGRAPAGRWVQ